MANNERFRVMFAQDAVDEGYLDDSYTRWDDFYYVLMDFKDPLKPEYVAGDGGKPEDQSFVRNFQWIAPLLNRVARGE